MVLKNILRFLLLVFVQSAILSQIGLPLNIHVFIYIYFILLIPYKTPSWLVLLLGFFSGMTIDVFSGSVSIFAFSATLAAFVRIVFFRIININEDEEHGSPSLKDMKFRRFFLYTFWTSLFHSTAFFLLDAFSFANFSYTLFLIIASTVFSVFLIMLCEVLFSKKNVD